MANFVTLFRLILAFVLVGLILTLPPRWQILNIPALSIVIILDYFDGIIARKYGRDNTFGAVFDIAADRIVEIILWVTFAYLRLIPLIIPLIVITRGILVDSLRNKRIDTHKSPFDIMKTRIGIFLVKGRFFRFLSSFSKLLTAVWLLLMISFPSMLPAIWHSHYQRLHLVSLILAWITVSICLTRGIPVLVEIALEKRINTPSKYSY